MHGSGTLHIEDVQDQVELELMRTGEYKVAKAYVIYRAERQRAREEAQKNNESTKTAYVLHVTLDDGSIVPLDMEKMQTQVTAACVKLDNVSSDIIIEDVKRNLFDKVPVQEVNKALIMSARTLIEKEPNYSYVTARLLCADLYREAYGFLGLTEDASFSDYFAAYLKRGVELELLDARLIKEFDLATMSAAIARLDWLAWSACVGTVDESP